MRALLCAAVLLVGCDAESVEPPVKAAAPQVSPVVHADAEQIAKAQVAVAAAMLPPQWNVTLAGMDNPAMNGTYTASAAQIGYKNVAGSPVPSQWGYVGSFTTPSGNPGQVTVSVDDSGRIAVTFNSLVGGQLTGGISWAGDGSGELQRTSGMSDPHGRCFVLP